MTSLRTFLVGSSLPLIAIGGVSLAAASSGAAGPVAPASLTSVADGEFTPEGGPEVNFVGSDVSFTAIEAGQTMTCVQVDFVGTVTDPGVVRAFGADIGALSELSSSGCTNPITGSIEVAMVGSPSISIVGPPEGTQWPARLSNVEAEIEAPGCSYRVEGTVEGVFDTATQVVTPTSNNIVVADEPTGFLCQVLGVYEGHVFDVGGTWTNEPPAGSTPLILSAP